MLKINNHFDAIIKRCVEKCDHPSSLHWSDDYLTIRTQIAATQQHKGFLRFVTITAEENKQFKVKFSEVSVDPQFTTQTAEQSFKARDENDLAYACRTVYAHINGKAKPHLIPSVENIKKWEEINERWLKGTPCAAHLFLQGSEYGDDWRFKIVHVEGVTIVESLDPATADGHNYAMLCKAAQEAFDRGVREGEVRAGERLSQQVFETIIPVNENGWWRYPKEVGRLLGHTTIRNTPNTI